MATNQGKYPVTFSVEESEQLCGLLRALASQSFADAKRTKSAAVRAYAAGRAVLAQDLESVLVRRLYYSGGR